MEAPMLLSIILHHLWVQYNRKLYCAITIILHHARVKGTSALVLFVIFIGLFLVFIYM